MKPKDGTKRLVLWLNGVLQVGIGLTGIGMHLIATHHNGQPMDAGHVLCMVGIALSGGNTLSTTTPFDGRAPLK